MNRTSLSRRNFLLNFASVGLGSTLLPGVVWAKMEETGATAVTVPMLRAAAAVAGLSFTDEELEGIVVVANQNLSRYAALRRIAIPNNVAPPFYFSPLVPGMAVNRVRRPFRMSAPPRVKRPAVLEDVAFWPLTMLAELIRSRQVTSTELTEMYLARLRRLNAKLNCVVTFLDDVGRAQARQADAEIAAGKYKGPLHGIPWGAKDIIAVKGYKTTWGSGAYKDQMIDEDAAVIDMLREAGAVLIAKLSTGELAGGDQWFGGRTNNPWKLDEGSSGSSAGPCSATAGGGVAFGIGSETSGSILGPSARCGVTGLRPTFGRVSRYGVMVLSWAQDRLGPLCRSVEDCAVVMHAIAHPDGRDLSVSDIPFNWDAKLDYRKLRVGYLAAAFEHGKGRASDAATNDQRTLSHLRSMGVKLIPITLPDPYGDVTTIGETRVEAATFFDELLRSGRDKLLTGKTRGPQFRFARFVPAVEFLQSQRVRAMMMQTLADATAGVDVYLVPANGGGPRPEGEGGGGSRAGGGGAGGAGAGAERPATPAQRHFQMANLACYPAMALPNGFAANGTPTSITFMARPFGETELLTLAKAYQDSTDFHLKHPVL
jgi:Asp-tRNA(Asn)/Glu-tRNA(Gln) amidotransferase A subunit family amidase